LVVLGSELASWNHCNAEFIDEVLVADHTSKMKPVGGSVQDLSYHSDAISHNTAIRCSVQELRRLRRNLASSSLSPFTQSIVYNDIAVALQDLGSLLAVSLEPSVSCSFLDVPSLLALSVNLLTICEAKLVRTAMQTALGAVTNFCGGLFSSHFGIQRFASAFEDTKLEKIWTKCLFGEVLSEYTAIPEIRQGPGLLSWVEEVQKNSREITVSPELNLSKSNIGVATISLLDSWRISLVILKLPLSDIEQVRRQSDIVSRACLDLAKICTYEAGREVSQTKVLKTLIAQALCSSVIDTALPSFLIALEKHSLSQAICETARYLTIQIFHTAVQYRPLLSATGDKVLTVLFQHIEPTALSPMLFCLPYDDAWSMHIGVFIESIDHPQLLWTEVNFGCQLCVVLSALSTLCLSSRGCTLLVNALSALRLPYSPMALCTAALDEAVNALSILVHGDELSPGYLRYPKPPYPLLPIHGLVDGTQILQQWDSKTFVFRSAIYLCDLLLNLFRFCNQAFDESQKPGELCLDECSLRYVVKACIRTIHFSRTVKNPPLSLGHRLENASLRVLVGLTSVALPVGVGAGPSVDTTAVEVVLNELLNEWKHSPRTFETAGNVLCLLMTSWRSQDILVNNVYVDTLRQALLGRQPELSELLLMWDGSLEHSAWMLGGGRAAMKVVWGEILSRVEFWLRRGHSRYLLKWFGVLRTMLAQCRTREEDMMSLEIAVEEANAGDSFEAWLETTASQLPELDGNIFHEIQAIYAMCRNREAAARPGCPPGKLAIQGKH
jgi:hypothetical protein